MATALDLSVANLDAKLAWVLAASNTEADLVLDVNREYTLIHNGVDVSNVAATNEIYFRSSATVVTDFTASATTAADKLPLQTGAFRTIGPGVSQIYYKTAAGSPTFTIMPGRNRFGAR